MSKEKEKSPAEKKRRSAYVHVEYNAQKVEEVISAFCIQMLLRQPAASRLFFFPPPLNTKTLSVCVWRGSGALFLSV